MTPEELEQKLQTGCYSVLTVTRDYAQRDTYQLSPKDLSGVLEKAAEIIPQNQDPVFVVMNEYMCSRKTLEYDKFEGLQKAVLTHSLKYPKAFYCINFLYQLKEGISEEEWNKLRGYVEPVDDLLIDEDDGRRPSWPIVNPNGTTKTLFDNHAKMFANESFLINNGGVVSRYRKSTYYDEDSNLLSCGWSYYYGFGRNELVNCAFSSIINEYICIDICFDIQQRIRLWLYRIAHSDEENMKVFFASYPGAEVGLQKLRRLLPKDDYGKSPESFSLHIVQSNSTAISEAVRYFPDNQVVVQSDPSVSAVFRLNRSNHAKRSKALHPTPAGWTEGLNIVSMCYPYRPAREWQYSISVSKTISCDFSYVLYNIRGG